jgi:hemoglobin
MRRVIPALVLACAGFVICTAAEAQNSKPTDDSVYQAFGQKAGIQALMEDFFTRLQADVRTAPFFKDTNRANLIEQFTDQLCQEAGGPCVYKGAPMGPVHRDLDIGKEHFNALVEVLQQSMEAKAIPFRAQNALLARLAPMHRDIITR